MAVKIRLARRGRKKLAMYDVVVAQSRSPRDGVFIEKIGTYNPLTNPATINLSETRALEWLMKGAQPTDTVRAMLSYKGVLIRKHLQIGVIKGAITQEEADKRFEEWKAVKDRKINSKLDSITQAKEATEKERHDHEKKINEARAAALREKQAARVKEEEAKQKAAEPQPAPEAEVSTEAEASQEAETPAVENTAPETEAKTETAAEETPAEETPAEETPAEETPAEETPAEETPAEVHEDGPQASAEEESKPSVEKPEDETKASE